MYSVSGSLLVTGSSCVALVTPERGHRRRVHRTWTDYTLDALDGPPATAPFVGKPDAASGGLRIGSLLTQERLGVLAGEAGHGKEFDASLTLGNRHRDRPVVHLGEFGGTSRTEGDHADASGFPKVLTSDRDLVAGENFGEPGCVSMVSFGPGGAAKFTQVDDRTITVMVPEGKKGIELLTVTGFTGEDSKPFLRK